MTSYPSTSLAPSRSLRTSEPHNGGARGSPPLHIRAPRIRGIPSRSATRDFLVSKAALRRTSESASPRAPDRVRERTRARWEIPQARVLCRAREISRDLCVLVDLTWPPPSRIPCNAPEVPLPPFSNQAESKTRRDFSGGRIRAEVESRRPALADGVDTSERRWLSRSRLSHPFIFAGDSETSKCPV